MQARRVIKLKELEDIGQLEDLSDRFRVVFQVNAAKEKLLNRAAQKAKDEEDAEARRLALEEAERRRLLGEARRRREEEAQWRREMAWYYEELNEWMRALAQAKASVGQAKYWVGMEEEKERGLKKEVESLMRAQVQLALRQGGGPPVGELAMARDKWLVLGERLKATEATVAELFEVLELAQTASEKVPPRPLPPLRRYTSLHFKKR